ncbi:S8 family serine peptidase [Pleomorphovibrio marinus]|uniref:S8 family serine peptidase n=1 Tax=Pleomorphovibrio marinus TaxID=2164132 RepID=UPI000E09FE7E|nr:S8 family serine peptidase [Pleomorphovibrio marinus]
MKPFRNDSPADLTNKPEFTGKRLVMIDSNAGQNQIDKEVKNASLRLAFSSDYTTHEEDYVEAFENADGIVFEKFGVAVVNENHDTEINMLTTSARSSKMFLYDEPERFVYALEVDRKNSILGNVWLLLCKIFGIKPPENPDNPSPPTLPDSFEDNDFAFWGVTATLSDKSSYTGKQVPVAILDTGFYMGHSGFTGRAITSKSFVQGEEAEDKNGHGTHCTGNAAGNIRSGAQTRYGSANNANIYIGKVLSNAGSGRDSGILAGMEWALVNGCKVISMSLGAPSNPGQTYSRIFNDIGKMAMENGTLVIAAAGNDSRRSQGIVRPVNHPANCPSILAVAALDRFLKVAEFSCGGINPDGGEVDIAGPGVGVFSSYISPHNYAFLSGTSMATPFVAGITAMLWEKYPKASATEIKELLLKGARKLDLLSRDVGAGLVQAPQ